MWIFRNDAMVSLVADRDNPNNLMVRARVKGDIDRVFGSVPVLEMDDADYRFRCVVDRRTAAAVMAASLDEIRYDNFKNSVRENDRHDAYMGVWSEMLRLQEDRHGRKRPKFLHHFDLAEWMATTAPIVADLTEEDELDEWMRRYDALHGALGK